MHLCKLAGRDADSESRVEQGDKANLPKKEAPKMSARLVKAMQSAGKLELPPLTSWKTDSPQIEPLVQSPHSPPDIDLTDERTASTARRDVMIGGGWEGSSTSSQKKTKDSISLQNSSASSLSEGQTVFLPPSTCPDSTGPNGFQEPSEFQSEQGDQSSSQQSDLIYGRQSNEDGPSTSGHPAPETELLFLGTSSGAPTLSRNVSGLLLKMKRGTWLFDCGEGTQHR